MYCFLYCLQIEAERQNEVLLHKWKVQLEQKSKEFEEWQSNLVPQDLDMLRIKVQEELEVPHMQKVHQMQSEIESLRQLTHKIRTEKVWLQTELERASHERTREAEELKSTFDHARDEFKRKIVEYEQQVLDKDYTEETRSLRLQLHESESTIARLKAASEEYRERLEEEVTLRDKERIRSRDTITRLEAKVELSDQSCKTAEEAVNVVAAQVQAREKQVLKLQERIRELEQELGRTSTDFRNLRASLEDDRRRLTEEFERVSIGGYNHCTGSVTVCLKGAV